MKTKRSAYTTNFTNKEKHLFVFLEILLDIIIHKVVSILEEDMLCLGVARMDDF